MSIGVNVIDLLNEHTSQCYKKSGTVSAEYARGYCRLKLEPDFAEASVNREKSHMVHSVQLILVP